MVSPRQMLYSLVVTSPKALLVTTPPIALEIGRNVFTVLTSDIDALVAVLTSDGATVNQVNDFTQPPTTPLDMLLEGESADVVLGAGYGSNHAYPVSS